MKTKPTDGLHMIIPALPHTDSASGSYRSSLTSLSPANTFRASHSPIHVPHHRIVEHHQVITADQAIQSTEYAKKANKSCLCSLANVYDLRQLHTSQTAVHLEKTNVTGQSPRYG
jgi:hypothetical protein